MIDLEPVIVARVQEALGNKWRCAGEITSTGQRDTVPRAAVRFVGAQIGNMTEGAVAVGPIWAVTLVVRRGTGADVAISDAFRDLLQAMHGWAPTDTPGFIGCTFRATGSVPVTFGDDGLYGLEVAFSISGDFEGVN